MITTTQFLGELLGSFTLIAMGCGVSMNHTLNKSYGSGNTATLSGPLGWGFSVAMAIIVASPFNSGAHFNPAVSIGFAAAGLFPWAYVLPYVGAQAIGSFFGAIAVWFMYKKQFEATENEPGKLLGVFATNAAVRNPVHNFANEAFATMFLVFISLMMLPPKLVLNGSDVPIGLGANGVVINGFLIFAIGMAFGGVTGWSLNPTRDLLPRLVHQLLPIKGKGDSDWGYGITIASLGPVTGCLIAAALFHAVKPYFF
ncbi:MAG: aquaporin family protein [Flavobacteriaceae bacterium]|jgi:glycerol uptake facilitator protein|nr:aquaporin family protein [Flavobacteriaceae bacterium]